MLRNALNQKGVTLVELLIALAILGIVLDLGMVFFNHSEASYNRGETRYITQSNVRLASDYITNQTRYATELSVIDASSVPATITSTDNYIYVDSNGRIIHKTSSGTSIVNPNTSQNLRYALSFNRAGTGVGANRVLSYSVTDNGSGFNVSSSVNPENLGSSSVISSSLAGAGNAIRYRVPAGATTGTMTGDVYPGTTQNLSCCGGSCG